MTVLTGVLLNVSANDDDEGSLYTEFVGANISSDEALRIVQAREKAELEFDKDEIDTEGLMQIQAQIANVDKIAWSEPREDKSLFIVSTFGDIDDGGSEWRYLPVVAKAA